MICTVENLSLIIMFKCLILLQDLCQSRGLFSPQPPRAFPLQTEENTMLVSVISEIHRQTGPNRREWWEWAGVKNCVWPLPSQWASKEARPVTGVASGCQSCFLRRVATDGCYRRPHGPRGTQRSGIVRAARTEAEEFWTADLRVKVCWLKRVPGQPGECPAAQSQGARICSLINRHAVRAHAFISRTLFTRKSRNTFIWWGSKREKLFLHLGIFEKLLPRGILLVGK